MADTKTSALTSASALADADLIPVVQGGTTKKSTVGAVRTALTPDSTRATINQVAHGLSAKNAIYSSNGTWTKAKADALATAYVAGFVESVTDADNFVIVYGGATTVSGLTVSTQYYLSDATAGLITTTAPTTATSFLVPVLRTGTSTKGYVEIGAPASLALIPVASGGTGAATLTGLLLGNGTSAITVVTTSAGIAGALSDETGSGALVFATSPTLVTPVLGTPTSGTLTNCTADGTNLLGYRNLPQNSQSSAYTTVLADAGKSLYHPGADTTARTWTIDSNANVAYPIGTALTFVNDTSAGVLTIAITSDTMILAGAGTTGSRTLAANGIATAVKMTSTRWIINGTGLT